MLEGFSLKKKGAAETQGGARGEETRSPGVGKQTWAYKENKERSRRRVDGEEAAEVKGVV